MFTPIVILSDKKAIKYEKLNAKQSIIFGNKMIKKNQSVIFETEIFGITEQLTLNTLINLQ